MEDSDLAIFILEFSDKLSPNLHSCRLMKSEHKHRFCSKRSYVLSFIPQPVEWVDIYQNWTVNLEVQGLPGKWPLCLQGSITGYHAFSLQWSSGRLADQCSTTERFGLEGGIESQSGLLILRKLWTSFSLGLHKENIFLLVRNVYSCVEAGRRLGRPPRRGCSLVPLFVFVF